MQFQDSVKCILTLSQMQLFGSRPDQARQLQNNGKCVQSCFAVPPNWFAFRIHSLYPRTFKGTIDTLLCGFLRTRCKELYALVAEVSRFKVDTSKTLLTGGLEMDPDPSTFRLHRQG